MDAKLGLLVKLTDPENPANVIRAQFATIRSNPKMETLLRSCAKAQVAEAAAIRKYQLALDALDSAGTPEAVDAATERAQAADSARIDAGNALLDAIHAFVVQGFALAGANPELAEGLAALVGPDRLAELKMKCQFGAGALDFTRTGDQSD